MTSTLRLLRILSHFGGSLQDVLRNGFAGSPLRAWVSIIPQLFSRMQRTTPFAKQCLVTILSRLAENCPHNIIYPTLVGSQKYLFDSSSYAKIVDSLKVEPDQINQVRTWITELKRITVLWVEQWIYGLTNIQADALHRIEKLGLEISKIDSNKMLKFEEKKILIQKAASSLMKPLIVTLENISATTIERQAVSPIEKLFNSQYGLRINHEVSYFINAANSNHPSNISWKPFQKLLFDLSTEAQASRTIKLQDASPYLFALNGTSIYIPEKGGICVCSLSETIVVIPTKTKPKRIQIKSVNGQVSQFLLKGHEDLHLDQKIQQFVMLVNNLLRKGQKSLYARTYDVLPLGSNYGMIQWIENAPGLFSIYRQRKFWENTARQIQSNGSQSEVSKVVAPAERFLQISKKLLQQGKVPANSSRNTWPSDVLLQIFTQLQQETPRDYFSNEIWISSVNATDWWQKTCAFSNSIGVMSIVGYIIGLGDRHLDNLLIDFETGNIIHIDFNVCFDAGKRLKVPETIPFRLTQNIVSAFGCLGVKGHFRAACVETLSTMRKHEEVLSTLLESFLHEPLIGWSRGGSLLNMRDLNSQIKAISVGTCNPLFNIDEMNKTLRSEEEKFRKYISQFGRCCSNLRHTRKQDDGCILQLEVGIANLSISDEYQRLMNCVDKFGQISKQFETSFSPVNLGVEAVLRMISLSPGDSSGKMAVFLAKVYRQFADFVKLSNDIVEVCHARELDGLQVQGIVDNFDQVLCDLFQNMKPLAELSPIEEKTCYAIEGSDANDYVFQILKKVKSKLEGKLNGPQISVHDHIDQLISHATDPSQLSKMFEGFMAWI